MDYLYLSQSIDAVIKKTMRFISHTELSTLLAESTHPDTFPLLIDVVGSDEDVSFPGAHRVNVNQIVHSQGETVGLLPTIDTLNAVLAPIGLSPSRPVVLWDAQQGLAATRLAWTLSVCGIKQILLLDGGRAALAADDSWPSRPPEPPPIAQPLAYDFSRHHFCAEDIAARLDQVVIVDARSREEYAGQDKRSKRAGHIPGALHFDWQWCFDPTRPGYLLPKADLRTRLSEQGVPLDQPDQTLVVYCQSHRRSSLLFCVLKHLGVEDVRGYPGAWSDWGNRDDLPAELPKDDNKSAPRR